MQQLKKIVVVGPESTGKSTLCEQLAKEFNTRWVPEYAREYLRRHGMNYKYDDLLTIAKGQIELEEKIEAELLEEWASGKKDSGTDHPFLFVDTNMYVMQVWCEFVFGKCHQWILDKIVEKKYDLYFLCYPDLPWVKDELREYPDLENRLKLYSIYKDFLINQPLPWIEIRGDYSQRTNSALDAIRRFE